MPWGSMIEMQSEATFSRPTSDCPSPEKWHARDAQATEFEVAHLLAALCVALRPEHVLETGSYLGDTSEEMGRALLGWGHLDSLESDPAHATTARAACEGLPVTIHITESLEWQPKGYGFDLMFFDSSIEAREHEIRHFSRFATPRAVWALHDTRDPKLMQALVRLETEATISYLTPLPTPRGLTIGRFS